MFYRDLLLTVAASDLNYWRGLLLMKVHETFHRHQCAVAFPYWQDNETENRTNTFDTFTRYANPGAGVRLFGDTAEQLEAAVQALDLQELVDKHVASVTPLRPVPVTSRAVAFCRSRALDRHVRTSRQLADLAERDRREAAVRGRLHQMAYVKTISQTDGREFSLHVERRFSDKPSAQLNVTSYGFSRVSEPCFLPDF